MSPLFDCCDQDCDGIGTDLDCVVCSGGICRLHVRFCFQCNSAVCRECIVEDLCCAVEPKGQTVDNLKKIYSNIIGGDFMDVSYDMSEVEEFKHKEYNKIRINGIKRSIISFIELYDDSRLSFYREETMRFAAKAFPRIEETDEHKFVRFLVKLASHNQRMLALVLLYNEDRERLLEEMPQSIVKSVTPALVSAAIGPDGEDFFQLLQSKGFVTNDMYDGFGLIGHKSSFIWCDSFKDMTKDMLEFVDLNAEDLMSYLLLSGKVSIKRVVEELSDLDYTLKFDVVKTLVEMDEVKGIPLSCLTLNCETVALLCSKGYVWNKELCLAEVRDGYQIYALLRYEVLTYKDLDGDQVTPLFSSGFSLKDEPLTERKFSSFHVGI